MLVRAARVFFSKIRLQKPFSSFESHKRGTKDALLITR